MMNVYWLSLHTFLFHAFLLEAVEYIIAIVIFLPLWRLVHLLGSNLIRRTNTNCLAHYLSDINVFHQKN